MDTGSYMQNQIDNQIEAGIRMKDAFDEWLGELTQTAADNLKIDISKIKINEAEAKKYFLDGFTPYQCFRESY